MWRATRVKSLFACQGFDALKAEDSRRMLEEACRVLRAGGRLLCAAVRGIRFFVLGLP